MFARKETRRGKEKKGQSPSFRILKVEEILKRKAEKLMAANSVAKGHHLLSDWFKHV